MRRLVPLVIALSISSTACTFAARKHRGMGVATDVSALAAVAMLAEREDCPEVESNIFQEQYDEEVSANWQCGADNAGHTLAGGALLLTAGVLGIATLVLEATEADRASPAPAPIPWTGAPGQTPAFDAPRLPAAAEGVDPATVRLGLQAWRTATSGYCDATRGLMEQVAERDPEYHAHLTRNTSIAARL
jgi:hypothetical protein